MKCSSTIWLLLKLNALSFAFSPSWNISFPWLLRLREENISVFPPSSPRLHPSLPDWFSLTSKHWGIPRFNCPTASLSAQMFGKSHPISCLSPSSIHWQFPNSHCSLIHLDPCIQYSHLLATRHLKFNTSKTDLIFTQNLLALEALQWRAIPSFQLPRSKNLVTSLSHMPHPVYPSASALDTVINIYTNSDHFSQTHYHSPSPSHHPLTWNRHPASLLPTT